MPKKLLTKRAKEWAIGLLKRIGAHVISYVVLALVIVAIYFAYKANIFDRVIRYSSPPKAGVYRQVEVQGHDVTISEVDEKTGKVLSEKIYYVGDKAIFKQYSDGKVEARLPRTGFVFKPGYTAFFSDGRPHGGLDIQWWYWNRYGLSSGFGVGGETKEKEDRSLRFAAYPLALNYALPFKWTHNTNMLIGYDFDAIIMGGSVKW